VKREGLNALSVSSLGRHRQLEDVRLTGSRHGQGRSSHASSTSSVSRAIDARRWRQQLSSPLVRQDIFYSGSVTSLREYKTSPDMATYLQVTSLILGISLYQSGIRFYCSFVATTCLRSACDRVLDLVGLDLKDFLDPMVFLPHAVNRGRFCFWRRQSVSFLFVYQIPREPLN